MQHLSLKKHSLRSAYTIVELVVIIALVGLLAGLTYFGFNSWRERTAKTEVKNDVANVVNAMKLAKTWANGFPVYADGTVFDGTNTSKDVYTQSQYVTLTYYHGDAKNYCIDAQSKVRPSVYMFIDTATGSTDPKVGTCSGGEGATPVPTDATQTLFAFDTSLSGCTGTVQLPIASPSSAAGSTIVWGDGATQSLTSTYPSHTYSKAGKYTVAYNGALTSVSGSGVAAANRGCLTGVKQWGSAAAPTSVNFQYATNLMNVAEPPHTVTSMANMFDSAKSFNQDISSWDTANVTNMSSMFKSAVAFNQPIGSWNVSNVTNMSYMFAPVSGFSYSFNQPIGSWNVSNVTDMNSMFYTNPARTHPFNQPIGSWNVSNVTNMSYMFHGTTAFNQSIGVWNTGNVTNMSSMFNGATAFNQPINSWNTSKVTDMSSMFYSNPIFNQSISSWNTGNVTTMDGMFWNASVFNQPINSWNTSKVTDMDDLFYFASSFNQNVSGWNVTAVTTHVNFRTYSALTAVNSPAGW